MPYTHFTLESRIKLEGFLDVNKPIREIGHTLRKTSSAIHAEIRRNRLNFKEYQHARIPGVIFKIKRPLNSHRYSGVGAQHKANQRRYSANQVHRRLHPTNNGTLEKLIIRKVKKRWSPEQISGALRYGRIMINGAKAKIILATQTIYDWIYRYHKELKKFLRHVRGYRHNRQYYTNRQKRKEREQLKNISKRPETVNERIRIGDWEGDTVLGKDHGATGRIATWVERKTGFLVAFLLPPLTPEQTALPEDEKELLRLTTSMRFADGTIKALTDRVILKRIKTLTMDNGSENNGFEWIERALPDTDIYFANPYHSWERGSNENTNGLLRQYFPKGMDFRKITPADLDEVVREINNRPRKRLKYRTPLWCMHHKGALKALKKSESSN
ncbi:IS30 family transposase [Candidatus Saccharibacteria bacterium]|nr:IS30 family transposase [Candidatus Saccharibacteria bacterium]